jgi:PAS domain S-box-containing protein
MSTPSEVSPSLLDELHQLRQRVGELERERNTLKSGVHHPAQLPTDHYQLLYEHTPAMSFALTPEGTILSVNRFGADQLGYLPEDLTGRSVLLVFDPTDHQTVREQLILCSQNPYKIFQWEIQKVHQSGGRLWVRETARAVRGENGTLIVLVMCEDITAQKAAEEQSRGNVQALQALVHTSPLAVIALDTTKQIVTLWNQAAEAMFGWHAEEILEHPAPFLSSDKREESDRIWAALLREGSLSGAEFRHTRQDGSPIDLAIWATLLKDPQGSLTGTLGFLADVTERKRAVEALRASEQRFRALYEQAPLGIAILDSFSGQFQQVNGKYCEITGYSKEDMLALTFQTITHPDDLEADVNNMAHLLSGQIDSFRMEKRYIRKDGSTVWVNLTCVPLWLDATDRRLHIAMVENISDRKEAAEALQTSEQRLKSIIQTSPECIKLIAADGTLLEINPAGLAMIEAEKPEDVIAKSIYPIVAPAYRESFRTMNEEVCRGNKAFLQFEIVGLRGTRRWMETHAVPLHHPADGRVILLAVTRNITERKQAEQELRMVRERLQHLMASSPAVIYSAKISGDYGATYVSENILEQLGYEPQEFLDDPGFWVAHIHPDDKSRVLANLSSLFREGHQIGEYLDEYRFLHKDGTYRWMHDRATLGRDPDGNPLEIIGSWIDITERKLAEQTLQENETRFRQIAETIEEVVWSADPAIGRMLYISPAYERVWGRTCANLYEHPKSFIDAIHPDDRARVLADLTVQQEGLPFAHEYRIVRPDGVIRWVWDRGFPIFDRETEQLTHYVGVALDITERKLAEDALRLSEEELRKAFEERERLSQDLHDNLLQSLYAVGMGLDLTKQRIKQTSPFNAKRLESSVAQLNAVIREVRSFIPRMYAPTINTKNVAESLRALVGSFVSTGAGDIAIALNDQAALQLSPEQSTHVLAIAKEALSNSVRHTKANNRSLSLAFHRGQVRLEVADDGDGFQLRESGKLGMGIRNMRSRAAKLNARFSIRTSQGNGTRLSLTLPPRT